jgi:hypothetical protein
MPRYRPGPDRLGPAFDALETPATDLSVVVPADRFGDTEASTRVIAAAHGAPVAA